MLEITIKSNFNIVTPINNEQRKLKINLTRYFSMLENVFNFIWLIFEGFNMVKCQYLAIHYMQVKY